MYGLSDVCGSDTSAYVNLGGGGNSRSQPAKKSSVWLGEEKKKSEKGKKRGEKKKQKKGEKEK